MTRIVIGEGAWEGRDSTVKVYAFKDGDYGIECTYHHTKGAKPRITRLVFGAHGLEGLLQAAQRAKASKRSGGVGYVLPEPEPTQVWTRVKQGDISPNGQ